MNAGLPSATRSVPELLEQEIQYLLLLRTRLWLPEHAALRRRIDEAIHVAECPTCPEAQPDGVPCPAPANRCERCARALLWVRSLRGDLERAVQEEGGALRDPLDI